MCIRDRNNTWYIFCPDSVKKSGLALVSNKVVENVESFSQRVRKSASTNVWKTFVNEMGLQENRLMDMSLINKNPLDFFMDQQFPYPEHTADTYIILSILKAMNATFILGGGYQKYWYSADNCVDCSTNPVLFDIYTERRPMIMPLPTANMPLLKIPSFQPLSLIHI